MRSSRTLLHNLGFLLALALVGALAWQGQRTASALLSDNEEVRHSLELIKAINQGRSAMLEIESGARGYVLTANEAFLVPMGQAQRRWDGAYRSLASLLREREPPREDWLAALRAAGERRIRISAAAVDFRRTHDLAGSAGFTTRLGGRRAMDRIRALLDDLEADEEARLRAGRLAIAERYRKAREVLFIGGSSVALLLLASLLAINLNLRTRGRLEARARAEKAFLRTVVDADQSLVYVRGADGCIELCNEAFASLFGLAPRDLEGHTPEDAGIAGRAAALLEGDRDIASGRRDRVHDEVSLGDADGLDRWFQRVKRPIVRDGNTRKALTVAVDITARRHADRMKSEFVSTVSHELRTPLTSIRGSLGLLASGMAGEIDPAARPLLDIANSSCERLVRLINDILDIEKLESGRMQLQRRPLEVRAALDQALQQIATYADQHGVRIETGVEGDPWVDADPDRLAQVMANLLSNAIKHSPPDSVVQVDVRAAGDSAVISVRDHGAGVPEAFRSRIFERFAQADSSDARQRGGTGLGLAISRSLVEQHGGRIGFDDAGGGGARFWFTLPRADPAVPADASTETGANAPVLLLVDDDPASIHDLQAILHMTGYRFLAAATGTAALDLLATEPVRAVLVSLRLGGSDPLAFVRELRAIPGYRHMPVLAIGTRATDGEDRTAGAAIGIGDWLRKPFDADRVVAAVRACVEPGAGAHVLHVEDDENLRSMVAELLAGEPVALHGAGSLAEARAALAARHHELVILDLMLPDGDGAELLGEIAASRPPVRVIIFSARDSALPESTVIQRRLVKSQHGGPELAALVHEQLRNWPRPAADNGASP